MLSYSSTVLPPLDCRLLLQVLRDFRAPEGEGAGLVDANGDGDVLVVLDLSEDESLLEAFLAREVVNRIQKLRKGAGLLESDRVDMWVSCPDDPQLQERLQSQVESCQLPHVQRPHHAVKGHSCKAAGARQALSGAACAMMVPSMCTAHCACIRRWLLSPIAPQLQEQ